MDESQSTPTLGQELRRIVLHSLAAMAAMGVVLGASAWWTFSADGGDPTRRLIAFVFVAMGAAALLAPFGMGRRLDWIGLCRWGAAVDAAGVALIVATAMAPDSVGVAWVDGLQCYGIIGCFALAQMGAAWTVQRWGGGPGLAVGKAVAAGVFAMTSLLWGHLLVRPFEAGSAGDTAALAAVRYINPLLAANDAVASARFDWPHTGLMYAKLGIIGEARAWPMPTWWRACLIYLLLGALATAVGLARGRKQPDTASEN